MSKQLNQGSVVRITIFFLLLFLRSHSRLLHPQVWGEDGNPSFGGSNIFDFVNRGARAIVAPVNGYLILLPKLISGLSLSISFSYYPAISTALAWLAILLILATIATKETQLRGGIVLGVVTLLVPSDPEVFGLPLYTFWWATLLLFAVVLWKGNSRNLSSRIPLLLIGGLSSPVIVGILPLVFVRAMLYRKVWQEWAVAGAAAGCAAVQLATWRTCGIKFPPRAPVTALEMAQVIPTFFGRYLIGNLWQDAVCLWIAGVALLAVVVSALWLYRSTAIYWGISAAFVVSVAMAMARVPVGNLHPVLSGPRYFFLPFVLMSWFATQLITDTRRYLRVAGAIALGVSSMNAIPVLTRKHDDLHWRQQVFSCPLFDVYSIPIQYDGHAEGTWQLRLTGKQCRSLLSHDLLRNLQPQPPTFPYSVFTNDLVQYRASLAKLDSVIGTQWAITGSQDKRLNGVAIVTWPTHTHSAGNLTLRLHKGQTVLYRTRPVTNLRMLINTGDLPFGQWLQPTSDWRYLVFSSSLLPSEFLATFVNDNGTSARPVMIGVAKD